VEKKRARANLGSAVRRLEGRGASACSYHGGAGSRGAVHTTRAAQWSAPARAGLTLSVLRLSVPVKPWGGHTAAPAPVRKSRYGFWPRRIARQQSSCCQRNI